MASRPCIARLQKEYKLLQKEPVPNITAHPAPTNLLEWHYALEGPADTEYEGGVYHGKVVFPSQYPYKPPSIQMFTPSGRFQTSTKLCLSMTDFHPESWNPLWSIGTILTGLLSFMTDTQQTTGSMSSSLEEKKRLAQQSLEFNVKNVNFRKLFPEWCEELKRRQLQQEQASQQTGSETVEQRVRGKALEVAPEREVPAGGKSWAVTFVIVLVAAGIMLVPFTGN